MKYAFTYLINFLFDSFEHLLNIILEKMIQGVLASCGFFGEEEIRELQIRELQVMF